MSGTTIVAATDGSAASKAAMERAAEIARATGAAVVAVHVMSDLAAWLAALPDPSFSRTDERLAEFLDEIWAEPLRRAEVPYQTRVVTGPPAASIVATAIDVGASCIVAGSTGRNARGDHRQGATALGLQQDHRCNVVIVTPAHAE